MLPMALEVGKAAAEDQACGEPVPRPAYAHLLANSPTAPLLGEPTPRFVCDMGPTRTVYP